MTQNTRLITPVLISGCLVLMIGFGIRSSYGVFQLPVAAEFDWPRAEFSLAIAIQNLFWGIGQPIFGAIADRFGDRKAVLGGILCYSVGLILTAGAVTPLGHQLLSVLVGFGIAGMGFGVILAIVGRAASEENRSMALGIATAMGSVGQIVGPPAAEYLMGSFTWQEVFLIFAGVTALAVFALPTLRAPTVEKAAPSEPMGVVLGKAIRDPSYAMIFVGFFSCGYQLGFITAHFPALVTEMCGPIDPNSVLHSIGVTTTSALGAAAIALIGFANIAGALYAGWLGKAYSRKYLLAGVYLGRTIVSILFIALPITPLSVILFSVAMGMLWLATVPLTSGLVAHIYGVRYMGTLYGLVFFSHQVGSFLGVWLGGTLYDQTGSYVAVWWVGIGVGLLSALIHLPIKEVPLAQRAVRGVAAG